MASADSCSITERVAPFGAVLPFGYVHRVGLAGFARRVVETEHARRLDLVSR